VTTRPLIDPPTELIYVPYADTPAAKAATGLPSGSLRPHALPHGRVARRRKDVGREHRRDRPGAIVDTRTARTSRSPTRAKTDGTDDSTLAHIFIGAAIDTKGILYILFSLAHGPRQRRRTSS